MCGKLLRGNRRGFNLSSSNGYPAPSILVIDDDPDILEALSEILESEGFGIHQARNGLEALEALEPLRPDLILLDLMMPVMDGWEFQRQLRNSPSLSGVPIIVISASKFSREPLNAAAFIPKPLDAGVLLETIESFLANGRTELAAR